MVFQSTTFTVLIFVHILTQAFVVLVLKATVLIATTKN